ncbi:MAG: hypothetical protein ABFR89_12205 [Actinomycetota bacterium]
MLTRRGFRRMSATAMALATLMAGCTPGTSPTSTTTTTTTPETTTTVAPEVLDDAWQLLDFGLDALRGSPDHRPAQLATVAAEGDPIAVLDWIRGNIRAMPDGPDGYLNPMRARWGPAGVLRGGIGTPRDVAELLAETYRTMGLEAHVVAIGHRMPLRDPMIVQNPPFEPAPPLPRERAEEIGITFPPPPQPVDPEIVRATAERVLDVVLPEADQARFVASFGGRLPVVAFTDTAGNSHIAHLWSEDGGLEPVDSLPQPAPDAEYPDVTFRLLAMNPRDEGPVPIAELTVGLQELVGRQVRASFTPAVESALDLARVRPADVTTFLPTLRVVGDDEHVATGTPVTLAGDRFEATDDGFNNGAGRIVTGGDASAVTSVEIARIDARAAPHLTLYAKVGGDEPIDGISIDEFAVTEEGQPAVAYLRSNVPGPRRVVFLTDTSTSVPAAYRGQGASEVARAVSSALLEAGEVVEFRAASVSGLGAEASGNWTTDPDELARQARSLGDGSSLWRAFADANETFVPDVIIFLTDGVAVAPGEIPVEQPPPEVEAAIRSGAPGIILGAGELGTAFEGIAEMSGGVAVPAEDQEAGIQAVIEALASLPAVANYTIGVIAPTTGDGERRISLAIGDSSDEATYSVSGDDESPERAALVNLTLEVESMGMTVRRTLAGLHPDVAGRYDRNLVTHQLTRDVHLALFGSYAISIDAGAPSLSQQLEQMILAKQSMRPVVEATSEDELADALAGLAVPSDHAFAFTAPLADGQHTHELAFRAWLDIDRRTQTDDGERRLQAVDILPFTLFDTVAQDDAFRRTAVASATLAVLEAGIFDDDPANVGPDGPLVVNSIADRDLAAHFRDTWPGSVFVSSTDGDPDEVWAVHRATGTLTTVLADASGGAATVSEVNALFDRVDTMLEFAGIVNGMPTSITLWADLERAKLAKLRTATIAILTMGGELQVGDTGFGGEGCDWLNKGGNWFAGSAGRRIFGNASMDALDDALSPIGMFNDWGSFFGFGDSGIPTDFSFC